MPRGGEKCRTAKTPRNAICARRARTRYVFASLIRDMRLRRVNEGRKKRRTLSRCAVASRAKRSPHRPPLFVSQHIFFFAEKQERICVPPPAERIKKHRFFLYSSAKTGFCPRSSFFCPVRLFEQKCGARFCRFCQIAFQKAEFLENTGFF